MSRSVKTASLQAGMRVTEDIVGKKGDIKVRRGEILSQMHVTKMKKWKGLDESNPRGIQVESSPLHTGTQMPNTVDKPWESPLVEKTAKNKLGSSMRVSHGFDKEGNIIEGVPNVLKDKQNDDIKPKRGRPKRK